MAGKPEYPFGVLEGRTERGFPIVKFVEDVPQFMKQDGADVKTVIETLQSVYKELKTIESRLTRSKESHKTTIPEIEENIRVIEFLKKKKEEQEKVQTNYQLSASIFADAELDQESDTVILWLGANTAAELSFDEATKIMEENLAKKKAQLETSCNDLKHVKAQITVCEVSIARVYNNDVKERRKQSQDEAEE